MFGDPYLVMHDGPDFTAMLGAARSNAQSVTRMLTAGISAGDPLAAESVTALTSAGLAPVQLQAPLATAIATASGTLRVRLAQALYALTADPAWADPIASGFPGTIADHPELFERSESRWPTARHRLPTVRPGKTPRTSCLPPRCTSDAPTTPGTPNAASGCPGRPCRNPPITECRTLMEADNAAPLCRRHAHSGS